jgi:general secretion pathway protein C
MANGANAIIAAELLPDAAGLARAAAGVDSSAPASEPRRSAAALIERNPFDSRTGALLPRAPQGAEPVVAAPVDPLRAPRCAGVDVHSTAVSSDPLWSSAVVKAAGDARGSMRRVGDVVGTREVVYIGRNPVEAGPAVWLIENGALCQSLLFDRPPPQATPPKAPAPVAPPRPAPASRAAVPGPAPLPSALAAKIQRVSATEFLIERSAVDQIISDYARLVRGARTRPVQVNGALTGFRLGRIGPESLFGRLGLANGDEVRSINGFKLTSPEKALRAYATLRTASRLSLQLVRQGRALTIDYRIR